MKQPVRRSIYLQFTQRLLAPLIVILFLATTGTLLVGYQEHLFVQHNQHQQLTEAYANSLVKPLWDCDDQAAKGIVDSIMQLSTVKGVTLKSSCTGNTFKAGEEEENSTNSINYFQKKLTYRDSLKREFTVGDLGLFFHTSTIFSDAFDTLWRYLVIITAMAIAIALGSMLAFRIIISRPLAAFRFAINAHIPARDCEALITNLPLAKRNDELTDVVKAYDILMDRLHEQKQALILLARKDPLTGLGNRMVLEEALHASIQRTLRSGEAGYVLLIDLDAFKPINDTLGHAAGDSVLQAVAQRLLKAVRSVDTVARLGGDEFVVIIDGQSPHIELSKIIDRITHELGEPFQYEGKPIAIKASIGAASFPTDGTECDTLLMRADQAMYKEKTTRQSQR